MCSSSLEGACHGVCTALKLFVWFVALQVLLLLPAHMTWMPFQTYRPSSGSTNSSKQQRLCRDKVQSSCLQWC